MTQWSGRSLETPMWLSRHRCVWLNRTTPAGALAGSQLLGAWTLLLLVYSWLVSLSHTKCQPVKMLGFSIWLYGKQA